MNRQYLVAAGVCLLLASPAAAQTDPTGGPDPATVRVRLGPLWLNPTIELTNLGVDTNVFNEPQQDNPKQDFTLTVVPKTQLWIRIGPSWVSGEIDEAVVWYQKYVSERSANTALHDRLESPAEPAAVRRRGKVCQHSRAPGLRDRRARTAF